MMLKLLYQLQEIETAEQAVGEEKRNSSEYKSLRGIRNAFDTKKQQYLRLTADLQRLEEQLDAFPQRIAEAELKLEEERNAIYNGSVSSTKALAAREAQAAAWQDRLAELQALQSAYQGEQAQKNAAHLQLKEEMEQQYADFRRIKESYQIQEDQRQQALAELTAQKEALEAQIDEATMLWYQSERHRFAGAPVAMLSAPACLQRLPHRGAAHHF